MKGLNPSFTSASSSWLNEGVEKVRVFCWMDCQTLSPHLMWYFLDYRLGLTVDNEIGKVD